MVHVLWFAAVVGPAADPAPPGSPLRLGDDRLRAGGAVSRLAFSPDGKHLVARAAGPDGFPRTVAWDAATGRPAPPPPAPDDPPRPDPRTTPAVTLPGDRVLTAGPGDAAYVWDARNRNQVAKLTGHAAAVTAVAASPDGSVLATADAAGLVRTWDAATFHPLLDPRGHTAAVRTARLSPDGRRLLTTAADGSARVWDLATGKELRAFPAGRGVGFTPDGAAVLVPAGGKLVPRDIVTGWEVVPAAATTDAPAGPDLFGQLLDAAGVVAALSPDGRTLAVGRPTGMVDVYEVATLSRRRRLAGHGGPVRAVVFTPDGTRLVSAGDDHAALVWGVRPADVPLPAELRRETSASKLWDRMTRSSAGAAYLALARLSADPSAAVKVARLRLRSAGGTPVGDVRAVELLEAVGTAEAADVLAELAAEAGTVRGRAASAALKRLTGPGYNPGVRITGGDKP
jgi:WD40 repeat protein